MREEEEGCRGEASLQEGSPSSRGRTREEGPG